MKKIEVSLILPVYNVGPWLAQCLESIKSQSFLDWEAILVIDGSTDNSEDIAREYASKDSRFRVYCQVNSGQGAARDKGVELSVGEYIFFLDPDDVIPTNALASLVDVANDTEADMVVGDYHTFQDGNLVSFPAKKASSYFINKFSELPKTFSRKDLTDFNFFYNSIYFMVVWMKLFRSEVWKENQIRAPKSLTMGEDFIAVKQMSFMAKKISYCDDIVVYYRKRLNSATTKRSIKSLGIFESYRFSEKVYRNLSLSNREYILLHKAFLQWYMSHLVLFTPITLWYRFYKEMGKSVSSWPIELLFASQEVSAKEKKKIKILRNNSMLGFLRVLLSVLGIQFKVWIINTLIPVGKRILPDLILRFVSGGLVKVSVKVGGEKKTSYLLKKLAQKLEP